MSTKDDIPVPVDLANVVRYPMAQRANKTTLAKFGRPLSADGADAFLRSLPHFLKAADLNQFVDLVARARRRSLPFHLLLGAHPIKVGLTPVIIDLMKRRIVTGLSFNGAGIIHDLEVAFYGGTSEDVQTGLADGTFGMVRETGDLFAAVCDAADRDGLGLGQATGRFIWDAGARNRTLSLFAAAYRLQLPATVHVAVGTDIVAQHPNYDAGKAAAASHVDFRILAAVCDRIDRGGAVANIGSAVMLPEVFLKALTVARNLKGGKSRLTTANFDMIVQYRPMENVVKRPTFGVGKGFNFVGHHEIMIPLLAWALKARCKV
jgi:hypothetical protein